MNMNVRLICPNFQFWTVKSKCTAEKGTGIEHLNTEFQHKINSADTANASASIDFGCES